MIGRRRRSAWATGCKVVDEDERWDKLVGARCYSYGREGTRDRRAAHGLFDFSQTTRAKSKAVVAFGKKKMVWWWVDQEYIRTLTGGFWSCYLFEEGSPIEAQRGRCGFDHLFQETLVGRAFTPLYRVQHRVAIYIHCMQQERQGYVLWYFFRDKHNTSWDKIESLSFLFYDSES